jgi:hypothetical protein
MAWDSTMPAVTTDGDLIDQGDLQPIYNNLTYLRFAAVLVSGIYRITDDAATSAGTERVAMSTGAVALDANTTYRVRAFFRYSGTVSADRFSFRIREDTIGGAARVTIEDKPIFAVGAGTNVVVEYPHITSTSVVSKAWVGTIVRQAGTGTGTVAAQSFITIERMGTDTVIATV